MLESAQLRQLVLSKSLGRIQVEGSPLWVLEQALENWKVVAECLSACGWRYHHQVPAAADGLVRLGLVRVETLDAPTRQGCHQLGSKVGRQRRKIRKCFRNHMI